MKQYLIYTEYENGLGSQDFANGYKELMSMLKDIHGYKDYTYIDVHEVIELEDGDIDYIFKNYK